MWKGTAAKSPLLRIMVFLRSIMQMPLAAPTAEAPITQRAIILKSQGLTAAGYRLLLTLTVKMCNSWPAHQALKGPFHSKLRIPFLPPPKVASTSLCHGRENTKPLFVRQGPEMADLAGCSICLHGLVVSGLEGLIGESAHTASFVRFTCPGSMF